MENKNVVLVFKNNDKIEETVISKRDLALGESFQYGKIFTIKEIVEIHNKQGYELVDVRFKDPKVIIEINNGLVTSVFSNIGKVEYDVLDRDVLDDDFEEEMKELEMAIENMYQSN